MEKKLTDEEIVKALEVCATDEIAEIRCPECILEEENGCCTVLLLNALYLIQRQKAEIERMKDELSDLFGRAYQYYKAAQRGGFPFYDEQLEPEGKDGKTITFGKFKGEG